MYYETMKPQFYYFDKVVLTHITHKIPQNDIL